MGMALALHATDPISILITTYGHQNLTRISILSTETEIALNTARCGLKEGREKKKKEENKLRINFQATLLSKDSFFSFVVTLKASPYFKFEIKWIVPQGTIHKGIYCLF